MPNKAFWNLLNFNGSLLANFGKIACEILFRNLKNVFFIVYFLHYFTNRLVKRFESKAKVMT